jgi:two-component system, NtrC family, sensor histidine kinase PilS
MAGPTAARPTGPQDRRPEVTAEAPVERRRNDRRLGDRRRADRRGGPYAEQRSAAGPETQAADSRFAPREDLDADLAEGALLRVARIYAAARAMLGVALVLAQVIASLADVRSPPLVTTLCVIYAGLALVVWLLPRFRALTETLVQPTPSPGALRWQWISTIGVDVVVFVALHLLDRSTSFNFAALLVLPVLMTGVLMPRMVALGTAATVALLLLFGAWEVGRLTDDPTLALTRAGLAGVGFFVIAVLAGELAARLTREEAAARDSLELARRQAQLNRLVIQEMADGVLVIDQGLRVRAANPAARALLVPQGAGPTAPFDLTSQRAWRELAIAANQALTEVTWPPDGREVDITFDDGHVRTLRLRVRFTPEAEDDLRAGPADVYCVLLLEDLRTAQARLRQEKLAAMGRVSAGIAHEIRNPLAAIAQANALLLEDPLPPDQQRLARMVADNVRRLQRIVDEVMELAPAAPAMPHPIDARAVVAAATVDWAQTAGLELGPACRLQTALPEHPLGVMFDAEHLRRILVNLLDNGLRHAGPAPGAVRLQLQLRDETHVVLQVLSDGPPIPPDVERYLFEPFFSTRSRGSGLGLYICRELCERYGASIDFRPRPGAERLHNEFVVTMRRAAWSASDAVLPLDS